MPFLNPPDVLPEAMRFLVRATLAAGGSIDQDELMRLVAPSGLVEATGAGGARSGGDSKTGGRTIAEKSLAELRATGLIEQESSGSRAVSLGPALRSRFATWPDVTADAFAAFMLENPLAVADEGGDIETSSGASDLQAALALLLLMPEPLRPITGFEAEGKSFAEFQRRHLGNEQSEWYVRNPDRYPSFLRWTAYLGFTRTVPTGTVVEPSHALLRILPRILDGDIPMAMFVQRLGEIMPYSDGGPIGIRVNTLVAPVSGSLSPGLALGLRRLEHEGAVDLSLRSDAESFGAGVTEDDLSRYSHIAPGGMA